MYTPDTQLSSHSLASSINAAVAQVSLLRDLDLDLDGHAHESFVPFNLNLINTYIVNTCLTLQ